jgi:hypothetical protein
MKIRELRNIGAYEYESSGLALIYQSMRELAPELLSILKWFP